MGKTLFPDLDGKQNSTDKSIKILVDKRLSKAARDELYSHESNGHGLLYIRNGKNHIGASHQVTNQNGKLVDGNKTLVNMIIRSKKETIKNMKSR